MGEKEDLARPYQRESTVFGGKREKSWSKTWGKNKTLQGANQLYTGADGLVKCTKRFKQYWPVQIMIQMYHRNWGTDRRTCLDAPLCSIADRPLWCRCPKNGNSNRASKGNILLYRQYCIDHRKEILYVCPIRCICVWRAQTMRLSQLTVRSFSHPLRPYQSLSVSNGKAGGWGDADIIQLRSAGKWLETSIGNEVSHFFPCKTLKKGYVFVSRISKIWNSILLIYLDEICFFPVFSNLEVIKQTVFEWQNMQISLKLILNQLFRSSFSL